MLASNPAPSPASNPAAKAAPNPASSQAANQADGAVPATPRRLADLPGPRGLPLVGNLLQFKRHQLHLQLEQWCRDFGPVYQIRFGPRVVMVVGDHAVAAAIMRDRPDGFRRTERLAQVGAEMRLQPNVFGVNGDEWKSQRRMVMAGFDPAHVKRYYPSLQVVAQRLTQRWQRAALAGTAIDLQADLMRYTVDTIAGLAFGVEVNTLQSDGDVIQQHLDKIFPALSRRMFGAIPMWRYFPSAADRQLERSVAAVKTSVAGFIDQARARMLADPSLRQQPSNLLEAMLVAADEPGSGITDELVAGNVFGLLLAGEDTTANTIAWMIHLLWRNPAALARATEEVRCAVTDPQRPTLDQMGQLDFIEACAHETMRLKPVAPIMPLQALRDVTLAGVPVPAGTVVISLLRRDAISDEHVPRAARFEPERWLGEGGAGGAAGGAGGAALQATKRISMPFGAGPRMCPGRYLALLEMKVAMATLLGHFDIASVDAPDGQEAREHLAFTMMPLGLSMRLRERA